MEEKEVLLTQEGFDKIEKELGREFLDKTHFHCYTIEYNEQERI